MFSRGAVPPLRISGRIWRLARVVFGHLARSAIRIFQTVSKHICDCSSACFRSAFLYEEELQVLSPA